MKWFKRLLLAALLLVVFVILAATGVAMLVDPNDYRDQIASTVREHTGLELAIEGEIELSVFPWLGLELGRVQLNNPGGFTDEVFAAVERVNIKVALLPLLWLETRVGDLELDGLRVNLEKRADGRTNWEGLVEEETPPAARDDSKAAPETPAPAAPDKPAGDQEQAKSAVPQFYIGSLHITNTDISWRDAVDKVYTRIENLSFSTGEVLPLKSIPFTLEFSVRNDSPKLLAGAKLEGAARMDLGAEEYTLENLNFELEASGPLVPGGSQTLRMQLPRLAVQTGAQTARVEQLNMQLAGLNLTLDLQAQSIMEKNPQLSGQLKADVLQLRNVMRSLGMEPPLTADPNALNFLNAQLAFQSDGNSFKTENLSVAFDETNISGSLAVNDFKAPSYRVNLNVDKLNADRYLPPAEPAPAPTGSGQPPADMEIPLPVDDLRALKAEGNLTFGELQLMKLKFANLKAGLKSAGDGIVRLEPLSVDLYGGKFLGAVVLDVAGKAPQYKISTQLSQVQIEPLLFDYMQSRFITGSMNAKFDISTAGNRISQFKKNLNGTGDLDFRDGALSFDLREKAREAKAKLKREPYKAPPKKPTTFSAITAGLNFNQGTVANKDLEVRAGHIHITGAGQYALPTDTIDYVLSLLFTEDPTSPDQSLKDIYGVPLKLHLKGKLATLDYTDIVMSGLKGVLKARAKQEVQEKKDAAKQELKEKLEEKLGSDKMDDFKERLRKKLGGD